MDHGEITATEDTSTVMKDESLQGDDPDYDTGATKDCVKIVLLDGTSVHYNQKKKHADITVGEVIKFAHSMSKVEPETKDLFSIYSYNDCEVETTSGNQKKPIKLKQKIFVDQRNPLRKLRDHFYSSKERNKDEWEFYYGVKFYLQIAEIENYLNSDHTRQLYCLQLCRDLQYAIEEGLVDLDSSEKLEQLIKLTSLMLQAENADFTCNLSKFEFIPKRHQPENYREKILSAEVGGHKITDLKHYEARLNFMELVVDVLPRYGKHQFLARCAKTSHNKREDLVTIANDYSGITVFYHDMTVEDDITKILGKNILNWSNILKILYKRKKFIIEVKNIFLDGDKIALIARSHDKCISLESSTTLVCAKQKKQYETDLACQFEVLANSTSSDLIKLRSIADPKCYLAIINGSVVCQNEHEDKECEFKVHTFGGDGNDKVWVLFESATATGSYLSLNTSGEVIVQSHQLEDNAAHFKVKLLSNSREQKFKKRKLTFNTDTKVQAKLIWKCAIEQHTSRLNQLDSPSFASVIFDRKTTFRSSYRPPRKKKGKYIIERKENGCWEIVDSPPNNMTLEGIEPVETDVLISTILPEEYHYEIKPLRAGAGEYHLVTLLVEDEYEGNDAWKPSKDVEDQSTANERKCST